jgi:hypothetical protein
MLLLPLDFGLGLWRLHTMARPSREAGGVHGQRFGLWAWPLEASNHGYSSKEVGGVHDQRLGL